MKKAFTLIELLITVAVIGAMIFTIGGILKVSYQKDFREKAIGLGMAEYVITDTKSGATEFKWKTSCAVSNPPPMSISRFTNNDEVYIITIDKVGK